MADGNTPRVLPDLTQQLAQMQAQLSALAAENAALRTRSSGKMTFKVSEKTGALMICGLQRFPITLYAAQWERILLEADALRTFIKANAATLSRKTVD